VLRIAPLDRVRCATEPPVATRPVIGAESRPALKVSFNRPRPRSQPAGPPGVCASVGCLFLPQYEVYKKLVWERG